MPFKDRRPLPVQRATKKKKEQEDKEKEIQYYRNRDPRINNIDRGYAESGRILPLIDKDE